MSGSGPRHRVTLGSRALVACVIVTGLSRAGALGPGDESLNAPLLQADLLERAGDLAGAIDLLLAQQERLPANGPLSYRLADLLVTATRYAEAIEQCERLLGNGFQSAETFYLRGLAERGLGWYAPARTSFAAALARDPANQDCRANLDQVAGLLGQGANSQIRNPLEPVPLPAALAAPPAGPAEAPPHGAVDAWLVDRTMAIAFVPGERLRSTVRVSGRVATPAGVGALSTLDFAFDPLNESIFVNRMEVLDDQGRVVHRGAVEEYYVTDDTGDGGAPQGRVLHVPAAGLRSGYALELELTREDLAPAEQLRFTRYSFSGALPARRAALYVAAPAEHLAWSASIEALEPSPMGAGMAWVVPDPPLGRWERYQPDGDEFLPVVWIADRPRSWAEVGRQYLDDIRDVLGEAPPGLTAHVAQLVEAGQPAAARAARLARYVQESSPCQATAFGKDQSLLLHHFLAAAGIPAHLALVNTANTVVPELPSFDQFNHMIVYLPSLDGGAFLDTTNKYYQPLAGPPPGLGGRTALVLDPADPRLVVIGPPPTDASGLRSSAEATIEEGRLRITDHVEAYGYLASFLREWLTSFDPGLRAGVLQSLIDDGSGAAEIQECSFEGLETVDRALRITLSYEVFSSVTPLDKRLIVDLAMPWPRWLLAELPSPDRHAPVLLRDPLRLECVTRLVLPAGYAAPPFEGAEHEVADGMVPHRLVTQPGADAVTVTFAASRPAARYPARAYAAFQQQCRDAVEAAAPRIVLTPR